MKLAILLAVIGIIIQGLFIYFEHKEKYVLAVILKGTASALFVSIGILLMGATVNKEFSRLILIGLILGMGGDIFLNLRFVFPKIGSKIFLVGVASFLAGHIVYLCAILPFAVKNLLLWAILIGVVVATIILTIIFKVLDVKLSYKIFGILYLGCICIMSSIAMFNLFTGYDLNKLLYGIGAIAFLISDIVLIFNSFGKQPKFSLRITNLSFYYIGQLLIAFSLLFI